MLKKIIIIENNKKVQCDSEEEVIRILLDNNYYELSEEEKLAKRETKAIANCMTNNMEIVNDFKVDNIEKKFMINDEMTYVLSLLIGNNIILLERTDSNVYTKGLNKSKIKENYIIVNKFAKDLLKSYLQKR